MRSPWGQVDHKRELFPGITFVSTPSHGGYKVDKAINDNISIHLRKDSGWYEEDVEWCLVVVGTPHLSWDIDFRDNALATLKNYFPDEAKAIGIDVSEDESYELRRRKWNSSNLGRFFVTAAFGSTADNNVPSGYVGVIASTNGSHVDDRRFLIPADEYSKRRFGFAFDDGDYMVWFHKNRKEV